MSGKNKRQWPRQGDIGFTWLHFGSQQRIHRVAGSSASGADRAGHSGGGTYHHAQGALHNRAAVLRHISHPGCRFSAHFSVPSVTFIPVFWAR
jgi:hypothetical protein